MTQSSLTNQVRESQQRSSRQGAEIDTFLIHHQAGLNDDATIRAMVTASKQVSANYTISNEGRLTLVVPEEYRAWTSGSSSDNGRGAAWDRRAITVEIENKTAEPNWEFSHEALQTAAALLQDLRRRYTIRNVLGHRNLYELFGASYPTYCPGPYTVADISRRAGGIIALPASLPAGTSSITGIGRTGTQEDGITGPVFNQRLQLWARLYGGYTGPTDGVLGVNSWIGIQNNLKREYGYDGPADGYPGTNTWKALQRWAAKYGYTGPIDGAPGPNTWRFVAKALNTL